MSIPARKPASTLLTIVAAIAAICVPCLAILHGVTHLKSSWDDGVITAAFARTLAHTGLLSLTPVSIPVEGTSSLSWTLLLTVPAFFFANPIAILVWMKILAGISFLGCVFLLYRVGVRLIADETQAITAALLYVFCITPFYETLNGMEMNFLTLLVLALTLVLTHHEERKTDNLIAGLLAFVILLTRWESPALLALLLFGIWLMTRRTRQILFVAAIIAAGFLAITLWRHHEFHQWLPNTVLAKRWAPYQGRPDLRWKIGTRVRAMREFVLVLGWPIVLFAMSAIAYRLRSEPRSKNDMSPGTSVYVCITIGAVLLSLALGQNWGHPGRMVLAYLPFVIVCCVAMIFRVAISSNARKVAVALLLAGQITCWAYQVNTVLRKPDDISAAKLEGEGQLADRVRILLGKDQLKVLLPDVGANALCCDRLQILDSALLANAFLAKRGWTAFPAYFHQVNPDFVIAHAIWSADSHIYELPEFTGYSLIAGYGFRGYLRNDLYRQLLQQGWKESPVDQVANCFDPPNVFQWPADQQFAWQKQRCINLQANNAN